MNPTQELTQIVAESKDDQGIIDEQLLLEKLSMFLVEHDQVLVKAARLDELRRVSRGINDAARKITPTAGARKLNYYDFDYYSYLRKCELTGEEPLPDYEAYVEDQR